jgi:mRNA interferase HigB
VHVITRRNLRDAGQADAELAKDLESWYRIAKNAQWHQFLEVRQSFPSADSVGDYVVFNIRQNRFRLITIIHYSRGTKDGRTAEGRVFIRSVLTHQEYDNPKNWDKGVPR